MNGYPTIFDIEMDQGEQLNVAFLFPWVLDPALKAVAAYERSLKEHGIRHAERDAVPRRGLIRSPRERGEGNSAERGELRPAGLGEGVDDVGAGVIHHRADLRVGARRAHREVDCEIERPTRGFDHRGGARGA